MNIHEKAWPIKREFDEKLIGTVECARFSTSLTNCLIWAGITVFVRVNGLNVKRFECGIQWFDFVCCIFQLEFPQAHNGNAMQFKSLANYSKGLWGRRVGQGGGEALPAAKKRFMQRNSPNTINSYS